MAHGLLEPKWLDSGGNVLRIGDFVHTLHERYAKRWYYKMPAIIKMRLDEDYRAIKVEIVGFGHPMHRTVTFRPKELTIIRGEEYLAYLTRLLNKLNYIV